MNFPDTIEVLSNAIFVLRNPFHSGVDAVPIKLVQDLAVVAQRLEWARDDMIIRHQAINAAINLSVVPETVFENLEETKEPVLVMSIKEKTK